MSEQLNHDQVAHMHSIVEAHFPDYRETDMQFNIGRLEGYSNRGADLINAVSRERIYVTRPSSGEAMSMIRNRLGDVILPKLESIADEDMHGEEQVVAEKFAVQDGMRSLVKTLRQSPYDGDSYAARLAFQAGTLLGEIYRLDPGMFGLRLESIAVGYSDDAESDDAGLFIVPPIAAPGEEYPIHPLHFLDSSGRSLDYRVRNALKAGFKKEG